MKKDKSEKIVEFEPVQKYDKFEEVDIMPIKDHAITWNHIHIVIKEGVSVPVPRIFLQNLVTEGVLKQLPNEG